MNNVQLKANIDAGITNKTANNSVTPPIVGVQLKDIVDYIDQEVDAVALTPGPTGPTGAQGIAGPVGPAGLVWRGLWASATSYILNDAVGYNGASYFCIAPVTGAVLPATNLPPSSDITKWALLASQGSPGPMGPQGIPGTPGTAGTVTYTENSINTTSSSLAQNPSHTSSKIINNFTRAYVTNAVQNYVGLSNLGKVVGSSYTIKNSSLIFPVIVSLIDNARLTNFNGFDTIQTYTIAPKSTVRFTLIETTSGSDKIFVVEIIESLALSETLISTVSSAPFPYTLAPFAQFPSSNPYALPAFPSVGEVKFVQVGFSNCTLWASPDPGNDGSNNNFLNPTGNGNSSITLTARKCYRFTYLGRFGGTVGFWSAEIVNNI